jgi:type II secretory pathway pseudopilin PulG
MDRLTTPGDRPGRPGYVLIILMMAVFVISLSFLLAVPVWQTELQREKEEELIFRGRQYVEAVRLYVAKNPGRYPASFKELLEKKFIRRLYKDPFARDGQWNVILVPTASSSAPASVPAGRLGSAQGVGGQSSQSVQEILVAPERAIAAIKDPRIIGVVSTSTNKSVKIYNDQESHDKWLFFYGQDPKKQPKIVYYGEKR